MPASACNSQLLPTLSAFSLFPGLLRCYYKKPFEVPCSMYMYLRHETSPEQTAGRIRKETFLLEKQLFSKSKYKFEKAIQKSIFSRIVDVFDLKFQGQTFADVIDFIVAP